MDRKLVNFEGDVLQKIGMNRMKRRSTDDVIHYLKLFSIHCLFN